MVKKQDKTSKNKPERDVKGRLLPGYTANPYGRKKETKEEKKIKKATKELIEDYKKKLAEALPKISPVLIAKAIAGNIEAIKEINNRVVGKPPQDFTINGEIEETHNIFILPPKENENPTNKARR